MRPVKSIMMASVSLMALCMSPSAFGMDDPVSGPRASTHAPIGVMAEHTHAKGEWMLSYRFMRMVMSGNRVGTDDISPDEIVTSISNRFGMPPTLRVVPTDMTMDMHMLGVMYAPNDKITLMAMTNILDLEMDHITYQGGMGTTQLGRFTTSSSGLSDSSLSALISLQKGETNLMLEVGSSLPTGTLDETDIVLSPMNTMPELRLPYPMQLSSGTFDPILGVTWYTDHHDSAIQYGGQARARLRLYDNDEDYHLGNHINLTGWASWSPDPAVSFSVRASYEWLDEIDGQDPLIAAPVQTADPDNHGGQWLEVHAGMNYAFRQEGLRGHRLAIEASTPLYQDLNGPQLERDWRVTLGWQFAFGG